MMPWIRQTGNKFYSKEYEAPWCCHLVNGSETNSPYCVCCI